MNLKKYRPDDVQEVWDHEVTRESFWSRRSLSHPSITMAQEEQQRDPASDKPGASFWLGDLGDLCMAGEGPSGVCPFADGPKGPA